MYAPSIPDAYQAITYKINLVNLTQSMYQNYNASLASYHEAATAGVLPSLSLDQWAALNSTIATANYSLYTLTDIMRDQSGV